MSQDPREKTWELAQVDVDAALRFARNIEWDWYRCQSLATVAWHTKPKARFIKIAYEALEIARAMSEPNRTVSCSAWVVRAVAQRDDVDILSVVRELLQTIYRKRELREVVLTPLLKACEEMKGWKQPKILKDLALILALDDLPSANKVVEMIQKESTKRKAKKAIEKQEWLGAHEFFPYYAKASI
jgi:hypothetical protein